MKKSVLVSGFLHIGVFALYLFWAALLSKPRMSYYAVDLISSFPAGAPAAGAPSATPPPPPEVKPPPKPIEEEKPVPREAIRVVGKVHKPLPQKKPAAKPTPRALPSWATASTDHPDNSSPPTKTVEGGGTGAPAIVAEAGPSFPYPWYLKQIAEKLDHQWHPPKEFESDTVCQVSFIVSRSGEVSDAAIEKSSGDSTFDQFALRAVTYTSQLPPLPEGYPEDTLHVHMKFVGKPV